jgi:hypothetical protein
MKFKCGHEAFSGKKGRCINCHNNDIPLPKPKRPKAKMGRPITTTKEEREENAREWRKNNPRTDYHRERARRLRGVVKKPHVIYLESEDKFKGRSVTGQDRVWNSFSLCHTYSSLAMAEMACKSAGKGVVMLRKGTKAETIANYKTNGLKG